METPIRKAFILAGGKGTRLRPITYEIPKPLVTVKKRPIINYLVDLFRDAGVEDVYVAISDEHVSDFEKWKADHYADESVKLVIEYEPLGSFGALKAIEDVLRTGPFYVSNGDELKELDLRAMSGLHDDVGATATLALARVDDPERYGVAVCDGSRITHFVEKPKEPPSSYINAGMWLFEPDIFDHFPHEDLQFSQVEFDLFPQLAHDGALHGYHFDGRWYDCGTLERWEKAIMEW